LRRRLPSRRRALAKGAKGENGRRTVGRHDRGRRRRLEKKRWRDRQRGRRKALERRNRDQRGRIAAAESGGPTRTRREREMERGASDGHSAAEAAGEGAGEAVWAKMGDAATTAAAKEPDRARTYKPRSLEAPALKEESRGPRAETGGGHVGLGSAAMRRAKSRQVNWREGWLGRRTRCGRGRTTRHGDERPGREARAGDRTTFGSVDGGVGDHQGSGGQAASCCCRRMIRWP
jgi:hypothetical protein